jgi:hypothetical protein
MILHGFKRIFFGVAGSSMFLVGLALLVRGASLSARAAAGDLSVSPTAGESACSQAEPCALPTGLSEANDPPHHPTWLREPTPAPAALGSPLPGASLFWWAGRPRRGRAVRSGG